MKSWAEMSDTEKKEFVRGFVIGRAFAGILLGAAVMSARYLKRSQRRRKRMPRGKGLQ